MPATINDVAHRAGVDKRTVTRVINNEPYVSPGARARVEAAIAELGFVPNIGAQSLRLKRTYTIALAVFNAFPDLVGSAVISITSAATDRGYTVVVVLFDPHDPASLVRVAKLARRRQADGLILAAPLEGVGVDVAQLFPEGFPWVHLGSVGTPPGIPSVRTEDQPGAYALAEYLLESGHRRIGYVSAAGSFPFTERFEGFEAALADHGIAIDPRYVITVEDLTFEGGLGGGRALLALDPRPTAICAASDSAAAGVLEAAHDAGLHVPLELSVAGFNDFPVARLTHPALTTVRIPMQEMDRAATDMLIDLINGNALPEPHLTVPASLVIRQSTGLCRESC